MRTCARTKTRGRRVLRRPSPLLCRARNNDRKSRHRRIKKQRRYERLAATSQLSLWYGDSAHVPSSLSCQQRLCRGLSSPKTTQLRDLGHNGQRSSARFYLSVGPDYILSRAVGSPTHQHLVVEPSPWVAAATFRSLAADGPIPSVFTIP